MLAVSIYYVQRLEDAQSFIKVLFLHVRWLFHLTPILTNVNHSDLVLSSWIGWYYMQRNVAFSMATSDKPSDKVGGLTNLLIMVNGLIMVENEREKEEKENRVAQAGTLYANAQQETWGHVEAPGRLVYILYILSQHCTRVLASVYLYISSPHQSTTSHPPSLLLVHFILNSHKSTSVLPSWVEISTNVLSSEKFEALEILVEGWIPLPDIQYTQSTTLTRSMVS